MAARASAAAPGCARYYTNPPAPKKMFCRSTIMPAHGKRAVSKRDRPLQGLIQDVRAALQPQRRRWPALRHPRCPCGYHPSLPPKGLRRSTCKELPFHRGKVLPPGRLSATTCCPQETQAGYPFRPRSCRSAEQRTRKAREQQERRALQQVQQALRRARREQQALQQVRRERRCHRRLPSYPCGFPCHLPERGRRVRCNQPERRWPRGSTGS